jgi:hypothetical protein
MKKTINIALMLVCVLLLCAVMAFATAAYQESPLLQEMTALAASGAAQVKVDTVEATEGQETVQVPVRIIDNPGIAGFTLDIITPEGMTLNDIIKGDLLLDGIFAPNPEDGIVNWTNSANIAGDGVILILDYSIDDIEYEVYEIGIDLHEGHPTNLCNENSAPVTVKFISGGVVLMIPDLYTVSGRVIYQPSSISSTVTLYNSEENTITTSTSTDGYYTLSAPAGTGYTLVVTKPGYLSYTIANLTIDASEEIGTIDISQLAGDVNGDGVVNATDLTYLLSEFNRKPVNYENADIDGNGVVNAADLTFLLAGFNKRDVVIIID